VVDRDALDKQWHGALDLLELANTRIAELEEALTYLANVADSAADAITEARAAIASKAK
jgi:hypothetical protein